MNSIAEICIFAFIRMIRALLFFLLITVFVKSSEAQDTTRHTRKSGMEYRRSDYINNLTSKINITPFIYVASNRFTFSAEKKNIEYSPNEAPSIGLRLQHKWLGIALTYGPKNLQADKRGTSEYYNLLLNSYGKSIGFDIYYMTNKGYYINNQNAAKELNPEFERNNMYPQRGDLITRSATGNVYYIFNHHRFSYRSSFLHNEIQKRSAGSFILSASGSYYMMSADSSIVPDVFKQDIPEESQIRTGSFYSAGLSPGYAFTLVGFQRLYFTLSFSVGLIYQVQQYSAGNAENSMLVDRQIWITKGLARTSMGFNSKYFYCGISAIGDNHNVALGPGNQLQYSVGNVQLFAGTRINFPQRFIGVSRFMDKVPLLAEKWD